MQRPVRQILADSHVGLIAIAMLLVSSVIYFALALLPPILAFIDFVATAIAFFDIPYFSVTRKEVMMLFQTISYLYVVLVSFAGACLISRWIYGVGPFRVLISYRRTRGLKKNNA